MFSAQLPVVFLLATSGILATLGGCQLRAVSWRFVRLTAVITLAVTVFILTLAVTRSWWGGGMSYRIMCGATAVAALTAFGIVTVAPLLPGTAGWVRLLAWSGTLAAGTAALAVAPAVPSWTIALIGYALGGLLVGAITVSWLLGHRYLTATEMTIDPLRQVSRLLIGALIGRWVFLLGGVGILWASSSGDGLARWTQFTQDWLIVAIRVGVGLLIPTVFIYMAWECVRLRSTQSATGILFFTSIFIIIGELASHYLVQPIGLPL